MYLLYIEVKQDADDTDCHGKTRIKTDFLNLKLKPNLLVPQY